MSRFFNLRRSLEAGALALLVTLALYVPPVQLAQRVDLVLFDLWTRLGMATPPADIVLVEVNDTAALEAVALLARHAGARLVVTTLPQPPSAELDGFVVGPVDLPAGALHLRRTDWRHGGHLWFEIDLDDSVRRDQPLVEEGATTPSLAAYAARRAGGRRSVHDDPRADTFAERADEPHWLHFYPHQPFAAIAAGDLDAADRLRDSVVIAGPLAVQHNTPVGMLSTPELLAHIVAGYRQNRQIDASVLGPIAAWSVAALLIVLVGVRTPRTRAAIAAAAGGACAALLVGAAGSFALGELWIPVTGPAVWLVLTALTLGLQRRMRQSATHETDLVAARKAAADGRLEHAWVLYRQVSPASSLLPELYDLACALDASGEERQAADLFHRIAQVDGGFRDVARRLVRCGQSSTANEPLDAASMPAAMGRYQLL